MNFTVKPAYSIRTSDVLWPKWESLKKVPSFLLLPFAIFVLLWVSSTGSLLWAKKATELRRQQHPGKTGFERSKLAAQDIPETSQSRVEAGTLNQQVQEDYANSPAMMGFKRKFGLQWQVLVDERSMVPRSFMGEGVPFTARSQSASKLGPSWQSKLASTETIDGLERTARQFLADNQDLLKVDPAALTLDPAASGMLEDATGKFRLVFQNNYRGVPILNSSVSMFISHGNMILYDAERIANINISVIPGLSPMAAVGRLKQSLGLSDTDILLDHAAELFITLVESPAAKSARARSATVEGGPTGLYNGPAGQGYTAELVYRIQFHVPDDVRSLVALVDANTGERIDLFDQNRYQKGKVLGAIYTRGPVSTPGFVNSGGQQAPEYLVPFDRFTVVNGSTSVNTNPGGIFDPAGLSLAGFSGALSGAQTNVREFGTPLCNSPQGPADSSGSVVFAAHFDDGRCSTSPGSPAPGNGLATHGARNGWFHDNFTITHAQKFLKGFSPAMDSFFNENFNVLVNDGCNAFWDSGCPNAGGQECMDLGSCSIPDGENNQASEPDTMSHEYGHALDFHTKTNGNTGDLGKGEGLADVDAWLNTHRSCLSPGDSFPPLPPGTSFHGFPQGDACNTAGFPAEPQILQQTGIRDFNIFICNDNGSGACPAGTTGRLQSNDQVNACGTLRTSDACKGRLGFECHCEGHLSSGSVLDLFKALVTRYGTNQAWFMIERLYYLGLPGITSALGSDGAGSIYTNFLAVDDDDGNLANGTPNGDLIFQAFRAHGIEGSQAVRFQAGCSTAPGGPGSPSAPTSFTATAQASGGIMLQWNAVAGATGYRLYRTAASQPGHNFETDPIPSSYYGRNGVFFKLINPATRSSNPTSGDNLFTGVTSFLDQEVASGYEYFYQIQAITGSGVGECRSTLSPNLVDLVANATASGSSQVNLSVSSGGVATATTIGGSGSVQAGYGEGTTNSGNGPYGTAVFTFSQNNVVVSEAGVPSSPATTHAKLFVDSRTGVPAPTPQFPAGTITVDTGVAIVNRGGATATITFSLRDVTGTTLLATGQASMAPGSHVAKFVTQLQDLAPGFALPANFTTVTQFGTLEISSTQPLSILGLRQTTNQRNNSLFTSTPIADLTRAAPTGKVFFPQFADGNGNKTLLILLNTSAATETGQVKFFTDTGAALVVHQVNGPSQSSFDYSIPPGGVFTLQSDGSPTVANAGSVQVEPNGSNPNAPVGAGVLSFTQGGALVTESGIPSATPTTRARIFVDLTGGHNTGLAIASPGGSSLQLTLTAFQNDGSTFAGSNVTTLNGNGHTAAFAGQFIPGLPGSFTTGVLEISAASPFVALTLRSLNNARNDFLITTFPLADSNQLAPQPLIFPQIADGGGFRTQFILLGVNGASTTTTNLFGDNGAPVLLLP